jgi:DNA-binding beta-propeller fold protein YncE
MRCAPLIALILSVTTLFGVKASTPVSDPLKPFIELGPFSAQARDLEMVSPKSVLFHPNGQKFYVNALEAGKTLVYDARTYSKLGTIRHEFADHAMLTVQAPGRFAGKPVEGWFTHAGRYLWVTYYRWSDDGSAMKASGIGLIDTQTDELVRAYPTGNIPKFVTANADSTTLVVTLWGENKLELFDIRDPLQAKSQGTIAVGPVVKATAGSDRDATCGMCLRGTVFLPGTSWLAVARMSAGGGLSIVDTQERKVVTDWSAVPATPRHLQVWGDWLYLSANVSGQVARISLDELKDAVANHRTPRFQARKLGSGARTLKVNAEGVYVALNESKKVAVLPLDLSAVRYLDAPAFPVGLDVADDVLAVTSQGHSGVGGHRLWLYRLAPLRR